MRVAFLSPLPPVRSGVAHYASMVLPALRERADVTAFGSLDGYRAGEFDLAVYQLGNNPHHEFVFAEAMRNPGVAVLHDVVLHHLIVEMTLARGDAEGYVTALAASHGAAGAAWARGRAAGLHSEMGNFLLPGSIEVANRSRAVIVHNRWAAERLQSWGVTTPLFVVPHPFERHETRADRAATRRALGIPDNAQVIGLFGFLTSAKRAEVVIEAFRIARQRRPAMRLLIVGEPAPNIDLAAIAGEGVLVTGFVPDEEFGRYYAATDRLVNLRYPSAGESSGTLIRAFAAGKPVAVSDYAQFAEFPDTCVTKIAFGQGEVEALADFFLRELDVEAIAAAQRAWLEENASIDRTVEGYLRAAEAATASSRRTAAHVSEEGSIALFPRLALVDRSVIDGEVVLTLRNEGRTTIRTRVYGQPGYRLLVKLFDGASEVDDRWIELPGDLAPGMSTGVRVPLPPGARVLRLYHALEGVPSVDDAAPAAEVDLSHV